MRCSARASVSADVAIPFNAGPVRQILRRAAPAAGRLVAAAFLPGEGKTLRRRRTAELQRCPANYSCQNLT